MEIGFLAKGLVIGFCIAVPVGPIGVLCIRRTLAEGRAVGLVSGLGAATADATYAAIAGFGLTSVSALLVGQQFWLRLVGGAFLLYLGVRTFAARPAGRGQEATVTGLFGAFASTLALTLSNPVTVLSFAAIFAGLGVASTVHNHTAAALLVAGVFVGSMVWWVAVSVGGGSTRSRFGPAALRLVNRIAGLTIGGFGLAALATLGG
jgi:threonine/homoserine/homoserine lactone efflux protein